MDASSELNLKNKTYLKALDLYVWQTFKQDLSNIDLTTQTFLGTKASKKITASITTKKEGILAGILEAKWFLKRMGISIIEMKKDGDLIKKEMVILKIKGKASDILAAERTLLNLIQRMSGIATKTKNFLKLVPKSIHLLATRKTLWGYLDKRAVAIGGGGTHRLNLSDAILIKENHITLSSNFEENFKSVLKSRTARFIEVELESIVQVKGFLKIYESLKIKRELKRYKNKIIVMLDDFKTSEIKKIIQPLKKAGLIIEVSGGINEKTISRYTIKGVDAVSSGALTMTAAHLDMSLLIQSTK